MSASIGKLSHQVCVISRCRRLQPLIRASANSVCENGDGKTFTNQQLDVRLTQARCYSQQSQRKGFISGFIDNIKQEINKNKEMKDNIKKFREEAEKLEQSDALQEARKKFENLEKETAKGSAAFRHTFDDIKDKVSKGVEEAQKQEWVKKGMDDLSKTAKGAAERVSKSGEDISKSAAFKTISESVKAVKEEIDESTTSRARPYRAPTRLRKRTEGLNTEEGEAKTFEANEDATGVVLHKDSKWYQQWKNFSENNQVFNKMFDLKMRYDESDNIMVRASKAVTDRVSQLLGGVFSPTELSGVLTEIIKIDPTFTKEGFLKMCELEIIPNILEAMIRGDLEIIKDWCYEAPYNQLATPIKQATQMGYKFDSKVLDVDMVELSMGKMMDQGPVLVITFVAQQIMAVRNAKGVVVEGDLEKVMRVTYVWVLCRDQEVLDPTSAWRLLDMSAHSAEQWV
ncbi:mitochondrial import inner membrane translocase subunit TIM44 isoform X2 [Strongylocentrotus purpuratus]|uniref:Mitochondrial import inner membrane translocase subunit TIM44 n=1 Tax=Strongylocentrotus purpuratus TaxID=7668 RepID=A0A7M7G9A0_STRPU|nr:mitochondrial import inner membrane translocase subunit TIM44 isoform X2 [Strongylocentrotus purpuratus]